MTGHVMEGLLKLSFTPEQFTVWVRDVVKPKMLWQPIGCVLHNTGPMVWPGFDVRGNQITPAQRIENMSVDWVNRGFTSAPHVLISPDGMVHVVWPLWQHGTHSPSWNATHFGIELVGDFDRQAFPDVMRESALAVMRALYDLIGSGVTPANFRFHSEDPRTTHKNCPGKNVGAKASWLLALAGVKPAPIPAHKHLLPLPEPAITAIKREEAFRATAYDDRGHPAIGYGRRDGYRGFSLTFGMVVTEAQASAWLREDAGVLADTIQQMLTREPTAGQLAAFVICAYNIGGAGFETSSMRRAFNAGDFTGAADAFRLWNKSTNPVTKVKEVSAGLVKRRERERTVFLGGNPYAPVIAPAAPQPAPKPVPVVVVAKPVPKTVTPPAPKPVAVPKPIQPPAPWWVRGLQWLLIQLTKP